MESILHLPQWDGAGVRAKLEQFRQRYRLQEKMELVQQRMERIQHKLDAATAGERRLINPLHFFAVASVLGVAAVVAAGCTPAYGVGGSGVVLGPVAHPQV